MELFLCDSDGVDQTSEKRNAVVVDNGQYKMTEPSNGRRFSSFAEMSLRSDPGHLSPRSMGSDGESTTKPAFGASYVCDSATLLPKTVKSHRRRRGRRNWPYGNLEAASAKPVEAAVCARTAKKCVPAHPESCPIDCPRDEPFSQLPLCSVACRLPEDRGYHT